MCQVSHPSEMHFGQLAGDRPAGHRKRQKNFERETRACGVTGWPVTRTGTLLSWDTSSRARARTSLKYKCHFLFSDFCYSSDNFKRISMITQNAYTLHHFKSTKQKIIIVMCINITNQQKLKVIIKNQILNNITSSIILFHEDPSVYYAINSSFQVRNIVYRLIVFILQNMD